MGSRVAPCQSGRMPRPAGNTIATPEQLQPVRHVEHRSELGVVRHLTTQGSLGVGYWFDKYDVEDFALGGYRSGNCVPDSRAEADERGDYRAAQ